MADARTDAAMLAASAPSRGQQLRRMIARLFKRHRLAQRLFIGGDGLPTAAARQWLRELADDNFVYRSTYNGDRDQMLINEGRRRLALEIINSTQLDVERLGVLTRMERESEHE